MFFMIGITDGRKDFPFTQTIICKACGRYGRYQVFMTFMQLLLFFIPCGRWNKRYYVEMSCCHTIYELNPEVGRRIARGEDVSITDADLTLVRRGNAGYGDNSYSGGFGYGSSGGSDMEWDTSHTQKTCRICGFTTDEDFDFCPKCGTRF